MLTKLLRLKHWQLFLLIFAVPFLTQAGMFMYMFVLFTDTQRMFELLKSDFFPNLIAFMWIISAIPQIIKFIWYWAMITHIRPKVPASLQPSLSLVKASFLVLIGFALLILTVAMILILGDSFSTIAYLDSLHISDVWILLMMVTIQASLLLTTLYILYFTAKTLKLAEMQAPVKLEKFIAEVFLLLIPIVGVWLIQPKVNQLVADD